MKILTSISTGSISILLLVYSYESVLVSYIFLYEATYRLSDTFLDDAIGSYLSTILLKHILRDYAYLYPGPMTV